MLRGIVTTDVGWWVFSVMAIMLFMVVVEVGYRFGRWQKRRVDPEQKLQSGTILAALLGLLGFVLAVSFQLAADRFVERKALVLREANAVGTTFLRAEFLGDPQSAEVRRLLREYVEMRLRFVQSGRWAGVDEVLARSAAYHRELWSIAASAAARTPRSVPVGLFIDSLNEVIDLHEDRVTVGLHFRIPPSLLRVLFLLAFLSIGMMGVHFGLSGTRNSISTLALVVSFTAILLLIIDLDAPVQHLFEVPQDPLVGTLDAMKD